MNIYLDIIKAGNEIQLDDLTFCFRFSMSNLINLFPEQCAEEKANRAVVLELMFNALPQILIFFCVIALICNEFFFSIVINVFLICIPILFRQFVPFHSP